MEQRAKVRQVFADGTAQVEVLRQSACSGDCHQCSGCGAVSQKLTVVAENPQGAQPGETVLLRSRSGGVLLAALVMYVSPMLLLLLGAITGRLLGNSGVLTGCAGLALGICAAVVYDRRRGKKTASGYTLYRDPQTIEKGDNGFD